MGEISKIMKFMSLFFLMLIAIGGPSKVHAGISEPVYTKVGISLTKNGLDVTDELKETMSGDSHTIFVKFSSKETTDLQALFGISNSKKGGMNNYFDIFLRGNGELGIEVRDADTNTNYLVSRPAAVWGKKQSGEPATNAIAVVLNKEQQTYSIYSNGTKIVEQKVNAYIGIFDINGIDKFVLGGVNRQGNLAFNFEGTIEELEIYNEVLGDEILEEKTNIETPGRLIYKANDSTGSNYFRIPVLYTLSNGRVFSSVDARYGGTHDFLNKINIATSSSDDNGKTWAEPKLTLSFDDFENVPLDWPRDPENRDLQISGGATYIDSVVVESPQDNKVTLMVDVMPAGVSFREALRNDSGFKEIDGHTYMKLKKDGDPGYNYTIRENGNIYDDRTGIKTDYRVDENYTIQQNDEALQVEQYSISFKNGKKEEFSNGNRVDMSIFYKDALFKVVPTNYIGYITSEDFGETWSDLAVLPPLMGINRNAPYLGPGRGMVVSNTNRIIFPSYTGKEVVYIYSDDNGETWESNTVPVPNGWSAEAQIVELSHGVLQAYMRTNNGQIAYMTSEDGGDNWGEPKFLDFIHNPSYGTQLSIINYSQLIDGKDAVILSTPNSTNGRRNGQIWIGLINKDDNTVDWKYHKNVDYAQYGFSYSALTELPNHDIGLFYEKFDSWSRNELHMKDVTPYMSFTIDELLQ